MNPAHSAQRTLGSNGDNTSYVGQHNVIYVPGLGYWAFYRKVSPSDRAVWRWSWDGQDWKAKDEGGNWGDSADLFPFTMLAPDAAWGSPSVWYAPNRNRVYVVADDAFPNIGGGGSTTNLRMNDTTGNKLFLRWGTFQNDGSILWNPLGIRRQRMAVRSNTCQNVENSSNQTWDPVSQRTALVVYSSAPTGSNEYVSLYADTNRNLAALDGFGTIALTNLTYDATDYLDTGVSIDPMHVYAYCNEATGAQVDQTQESQSAPVVAPIVRAGVPNTVMLSRSDNLGDNVGYQDASILRLDINSRGNVAAATEVNNLTNTTTNPDTSQIYMMPSADDQDGYGAQAVSELNSENVHFVYIDNGGDVAYRRRATGPAYTGPIVLDNSGTATSGSAAPLVNPEIGIVYKNQTWVGKELYIFWTNNAQDTLKYVTCRSTMTDMATGCDGVKDFAYGNNLAYPKLGFWGSRNEPFPIMWSDTSKVYFDKIITSTFTAPNVTSMSTAPAQAYLTMPNYDLVINGNNFEYIPDVSSPTPRFMILKSSETQSEITVTSAAWISKSQIRASIVLSTFVAAGFDYDLRYVQGDGQEYPTRYDRDRGSGSDKVLTLRLNPPTINSVSDLETGPNPYVSGGVVMRNDATEAYARSVRITGTDFMNWTGKTGTVLAGTDTVRVSLRNQSGVENNEVSVASLTYSGSTSVTAYLRISTAAAGGAYTVMLMNPASGYALSVGSTFYVTVPTATITYPGSGVSTGFEVIKGTVGFNNYGQTSVIGADVRIQYKGTNKFWNGSVMTTSGFVTEEDKWKAGSLSGGSTAYYYTAFNTSSLGNIPDDGEYIISVRGRTNDGGIGTPDGYPDLSLPISSTVVNLDRFTSTITYISPNYNTFAASLVDHVIVQFNDLGTGVTTTQLLIQDVTADINDPLTWVAFSTSGNKGPAGSQIWLSTPSVANQGGTPQTIWTPGQVGTVTVDIASKTTSIAIPHWEDGHKYRISAKVQDGVPGHTVDHSTSGVSAYVTFIYDVWAPTMTITYPSGLATSSGAATWVTSFGQIAGQVRDNVNDAMDPSHIYLRVAELVKDSEAEVVARWLDPAD
ncbi:MAG: hypothetical protein WC881_05180, partial [Elusimicrobiota bacterium]